MPAPTNQPPERNVSIQQRYQEKLKKYSAVHAVVDRPDVPAKGKLFVVLYGTTTTGVVALGISRAPWEAYASLIVCTLFLALLINQIPPAAPPRRKAKRARWPGPPKPRPRRRNQREL